MARGPLFEDSYKPQFSGHETFPLRYGWLKKAFDAIQAAEDQDDNRSVFSGEDAIARFGVGKNMVSSMRHWAVATGIIKEATDKNRLVTTALGQRLFGTDGLDPYMEDPATSWLVHWHLCGRPNKTTWFWAFSHYPALPFERETLVKALKKLAEERTWDRASKATIRRDVTCFVRTYVAQRSSKQAGQEDALESPLTELGLIKRVGKSERFRFVRGQKPSLGAGVFCYAVTDFWNRFPKTAQTLSFETLAYEPGSPGRVFLLDENDVVDMLTDLEEASEGIYTWSETAGLKQLVRKHELSVEAALDFINLDYAVNNKRDAA